MQREIHNVPEEIRKASSAIEELIGTSVPRANGTSEVSTGGLTARYSDGILNLLDFDLKTNFQLLMHNSKEKFKDIADDCEKSDINASV